VGGADEAGRVADVVSGGVSGHNLSKASVADSGELGSM